MENIEMLYLYVTARDDGMNFAVGAHYKGGGVNGSYALFASAVGAQLFLSAAHDMGVRVEILPSGENAGIQLEKS